MKHVGEGEVLRVSSLTKNGQRELTFEGERVTEARFQSLPSYSTVEKFGHANAKRIALTFDDGPDPVWTPEVLGVLRQHDVHATFFVIGDEVEKYPPIVRQVIAEGHVLGNHTFYHPNISQISDSRLRAELNFTQRAIESATGRSTILFRAPFDIDSTPSKPNQLAPLYKVAQLGYLVVGGNIDASDYSKPGTDVIVNNVLAELREDGPNIVVMHDGGGDWL